MDKQSQVTIIRLHCEHLRTVLAQVILELVIIEQRLTMPEFPSSALGEPDLNEITKQSELLAVETERLRGFVRFLLTPDPPENEAQ